MSIVQQCFYPDGETIAVDVPCNSAATHSACCNVDAQCLDNGLCFRGGTLSRGSCTDRSWGPSCAQYCLDGGYFSIPVLRALIGVRLMMEPDPSTFGAALVTCNGYTAPSIFACGTNNTDCLTDTNTFPIVGGTDFILRDVVVGGQSSAALTISPTSTLNLVQDAQNTGVSTPSTSSSTTGPKISSGIPAPTAPRRAYSAASLAGAVAGTGVPLLLALLGAIFIILRQRKELRQRQRSQPDHMDGAPVSYGDGQGHYPPLMQKQGTAHTPPVEAYAEREPVELGGHK